MKNTEIAFYSLIQYLLLVICMDIKCCKSEVMEIQLKYIFHLFSIYLKVKAFKYLKN